MPYMINERLSEERQAFEASYADCGLIIPEGTERQALRAAVAYPFMPTESHDVIDLHGMSWKGKEYFNKTVHPLINGGIAAEDGQILGLGIATGRYLAAAVDAGTLNVDPPLHIGQDSVLVDSQLVNVELQGGRVVEYGMGLNGLISHLGNLKDRRYTIAAITKNVGEAVLLDGVAEYFGVANAVINEAGGIGLSLNDMLRADNEYRGGVNLLVVSRVCASSRELRQGILRASQLLAPDGVMIARGLRINNQGIGYEEIGNLMRRDKLLGIEFEHAYDRWFPSGVRERHKLTVARKRTVV